MPSNPELEAPTSRVLLTGATGYVGGRLLRALEDRGHRVRCLARKPEHLASRVAPQTEVFAGDVVSGEGLAEALSGVETAYYLVHSMGSAGGFEEEDRRAARNFGAAARAAGVRRIVYLGGLADESGELSPHLRSRLEVGRLLRDSGVPVIELRASIVIGSGSLSFEMIRALVEHLPVMVMPRWVSMRSQPIGIDDLIAYLLEALNAEPSGDAIYEIGGADRVSYADLMREYARQRGLRRVMLPVPVLTPRLSSLWLGLVTPLYARVGRKLIDSIRHPSIVRSDAARRAFRVVPSDVATAIARALEKEDREFAETRWSDALSASGAAPPSFGGVRIGPRLVDSREFELPVPASRAFAAVRRIGGRTGWYRHDWLWQLRGLLDLLVGGAGMRRGRRDPEQAAVGDTIDCWRVTGFVPDRSLRLEAEMRLPGRAWLEFEVSPCEGGSRLRQTAVFQPSGLLGLAYWYGVYPLHSLVYRGMLQGIASAVLAADDPSAPRQPGERVTLERALEESLREQLLARR
ncbi:MAG: SDR family oxidoreductase [Planctomycetota bacterium]